MGHPAAKANLADVLESKTGSDQHPAVWTSQHLATWGELANSYRHSVATLLKRSAARLGLAVQSSAPSMAALAACQRVGADVYLLDGTLSQERLLEVAKPLRLHELYFPDTAEMSVVTPMDPGAEAASDVMMAPSGGSITILTSGTSGGVKAVRHDWERLVRPVRFSAEGSDQRWLLAYRPHLYAGLQVVLQALMNEGTLVAPSASDDPSQIARLMAESQVQYASATPSYWRRLLLWADPKWISQIRLRQITLGGEAIDQEILDRLRQVFPSARIVHIYATTELGRCFSVTDARAGFPCQYLASPSQDGIELQIREGQLWVRSANAMTGYTQASTDSSLAQADETGWFPTGDLVEIADERVRFVGRMSDIVNVGGNKVHPLVVESVIREVTGVADVRVYGQSSSIAGQLVACQIVAKANVSEELLRQQVLTHCRSRLERFQIPRVLEFVERLELTSAGKLARR